MIQRYRGGIVPKSGSADLRGDAEKTTATFCERMIELDFSDALESLWSFVTRANRYVEESKPWALAKDAAQAARLDAVLFNLAESVRLISVLVSPFMPTMAAQIREQLGVQAKIGTLDAEVRWGGVVEGTKLGQVAPLFPKSA